MLRMLARVVSSAALILVPFAVTSCGGGGAASPTPGMGNSSPQIPNVVSAPLNIYVPDLTGASVSVYPATSNGNVTPIRKILGPLTQIVSPFGIAFDSRNDMYVTNKVAGCTGAGAVTIYAPGASGNAAPIKVISGSNTLLNDPRGIFIDAADNAYVADVRAGQVLFFGAGASGNVAPLRVLSGPHTGLLLPEDVVLDRAGDIFVSNSAPVDTILEFAPGASGDTPPIATIAGDISMVNDPRGLAMDSLGNLYVGSDAANAILVFAPGSNGNVAPIADIAGPLTTLENNEGIALDNTGKIYAADLAESPVGSVLVFPPGSNGNVAPIQTISGSNTGLSSPAFLAVHT